MFTWLQTYVFYPVSEFFGVMEGLAMIRPDNFFELLGRALDGQSGLSIFVQVPNIWESVDPDNVELLFRGFRIDFDIFTSGIFKLIGVILYGFGNFLFAGVSQFPLFVALPLGFIKIALILGLSKFLFGQIKFWGGL